MWMPKEHLYVLVYLITAMHSMQGGYLDKAQKYTDKALMQIEKLKSKLIHMNATQWDITTTCSLRICLVFRRCWSETIHITYISYASVGKFRKLGNTEECKNQNTACFLLPYIHLLLYKCLWSNFWSNLHPNIGTNNYVQTRYGKGMKYQ